MSKNELTCVTGYWKVKNKHGVKFNNWFSKTMNVDHPYIIFCDESRNLIETHRKSFPTTYIDLSLDNCYLHNKQGIWTHPTHCPSVALNTIWNEKVFLLRRAKEINPYNSEWFVWIDAGICSWRNRTTEQPLRLKQNVLSNLPKDKFIFCSSNSQFVQKNVLPNVYYHYVSAGIFLMHHSIIDKFCVDYQKCLDDLLVQKARFTEQVAYTHLYARQPELFFRLMHGYGAITRYLFS